MSADRYFLIAPASLYPRPEARIIDGNGEAFHVWSSSEEQPPAEAEPPGFLRGWNHVELDRAGNLYALVPLRAVLKLDRRSRLVWKSLVAAHHDIALEPDGRCHVLVETPTFTIVDGRPHLLLDHLLTLLDVNGRPLRAVSLADVLASNRETRERLQAELRRRYRAAGLDCWPSPGAEEHAPITEVNRLLAAPDRPGLTRELLQTIRQLPASPCDAIHPNTLELLDAQRHGRWERGNVLLALRSLDLIVAIDLDAPRVVWSWGAGELSGPHQPSALADGNVLVFDNGVQAGRSRVVEVDPASGRIVWEYVSDPPEAFFCEVAGGCEQLANGNVLITDAQAARIFEVTRERRIVNETTVGDVPEATNPHRTTLYRGSAVDASLVDRITSGLPSKRSGIAS